ncbi:hypothetical protein [uncultured Apibacter sp.]|uniref:hypothetical protein n=1 Tax=uncultured Apibacter sp. TaxID=1778616 RepID=UPI0025FA167A|nr:hypothetical protein [uncultured Apibacter sp.]
MKLKLSVLFIFTYFLMLHAQSRKDVNIDLEKITQYIKLQERNSEEIIIIPEEEFIPTEEYMLLQQSLIEKSLEKSGYKVPEYSIFRERIKHVFGIDLDKSKEKVVTLYGDAPVNGREKAYDDDEIKNLLPFAKLGFNQYKYEYFGYPYIWNMFINKEKKILNYYIKNLGSLIKIYNKKNKKYKIKKDLLLLHLNKYIVYNDKASLDYLLSEVPALTRSLVSNFNYDKEDKINESVMDDLYTTNADDQPMRESELRELIFVKKIQTDPDRLYIREGILKTIENITNENNCKYAIDLSNALVDLLDRKREGEDIGWTNEELYKMVAYSANYIDPLYWKYHNLETVEWGDGNILGAYDSLLSKEEGEAMLKQFEQNNYYNLPYLKEAIKITKKY